MMDTLGRWVGWATPLVPAFNLAAWARELRHVEHDCLARKQGRCPGKYHCADCAWSEGPSGSSR